MSEHDRVRIDDLNPTASPSPNHELPAMHEGQTHKLSVSQIAAIARLFDGSGSDFSFSSEELGAALRELGTALESLDTDGVDNASDVEGGSATAALNNIRTDPLQTPLPMAKAPPEMTWVDDDEISIAAGKCRDEDDETNIVLPSSITIDNISVGNDAHRHVLVGRDGNGDPIAELSETIVLPSGWQTFRRVGSIRTNNSGDIIRFKQIGDWVVHVSLTLLSITSSFPTSFTALSCPVPLGVEVFPVLHGRIETSAVGSTDRRMDITNFDEIMSNITFTLARTDDINTGANAMVGVPTDTEGRIKYRFNGDDRISSASIIQSGWIDQRGRDK